MNRHARALYDRGLRDASAGRTDLAIDELTASLDVLRRDPMPDDGPVALRYVKLAELLDSKEKTAKVTDILMNLDSLSQGELASDLARAKICLNHGDDSCAEVLLRDLSHRYPTNYDVLILLGDLEFRRQNYAEALDCYTRAGGGWFGGTEVHLSMAKSLHALGRSAEASDQCRMAGALDPRDRATQFACIQIGVDQISQ